MTWGLRDNKHVNKGKLSCKVLAMQEETIEQKLGLGRYPIRANLRVILLIYY
jgi:hypothetical protein